MYPAKSLFTKVIMNMLGGVLTRASVLGNGFVLALIARFKGTLSRCSAHANLTGFFHRKTIELSLCRVMPTELKVSTERSRLHKNWHFTRTVYHWSLILRSFRAKPKLIEDDANGFVKALCQFPHLWILNPLKSISCACAKSWLCSFKSLRTVPKILVANLAVVDLLHVSLNLPFHMISNSEASWYRGQTLAILTAFLNRVFVILNLASMLAMMANVFLAIAFDFKYLAWKTKKKAMICVLFIGLTSFMVTILGSTPLLDINLAGARVRDYRAEIYKQGKYFVGSLTGFCILCGGVLDLLTTRAIK